MKDIYPKILGGFLAMILYAGHLSAQQDDYKEYKPLLLKNAARLGISVTDANDAVITKAYTDPATQLTYIYLQQAYQQIKVYNTIISITFRNGSLLYHSGSFVNDIAAKAGNSTPAKSYTDAVIAAARHLELPVTGQLSTIADVFTAERKYTVTPAGIARRNIDVTLYWTPSDDKQQVTLTWNVNIDVLGNEDWWNVRINAQTGEFTQKDNWTVHEHMPDAVLKSTDAVSGNNTLLSKQLITTTKVSLPKKQDGSQILLQSPPPNVTSATYRVLPFPVESPIHGSFANAVNPWLLAGAGNNAVTLGWHFDSTDNYTITRGNNVFAFLDRRNNNIADATRNWPDTSTTPAPSLTFVHNINTSQQPARNTENKKVALDNLFYWNNLMHDVSYQYGFTEAAGNFQRENLRRGGAGNDFVMANAQDSAGYSNANFSTPDDGTSGRMQMYTFSTPPVFTVNSPVSVAGNYTIVESNFTGTPNKLVNTDPIIGQIALYNDDSAGIVHTACIATAPYNATALNGKIVLIEGGTCTAISKVKKAQNAGAIAVLLYSANLTNLTGTDATVVIPAVSITTNVATAIITQLKNDNPVTATLAAGIYIDGDLDNGVICHEYAHGISSRLTGGPFSASCLSNAEQGGEGWSDYFGLMMTTNWATAGINDGSNLRPIGTYVLGQTNTGVGIRRYPYTTNMFVDPLTYANMATSTEVHDIGEIWCSAIWDMTWNIIQQTGIINPNLYNSAGTGGNTIAMNLVMTGLKLQPCQPGFLDARNAILAADSILYNNAHVCAIWNAFARRGMGFSALQGLATRAYDQTAAFDLPAGLQIARPMPLIVSVNSQTTITHTASCQCTPATNYVLRDTIPAGFTYISSNPAGTLNGSVLSFPATSFAALESKNFSVVLQAPTTGCTIDSVLNDNRESSTTGSLTSSGTPGWSTSTVQSHTPTSSWFAPEPITVTSLTLTSATTTVTAAKNLSILSFWHYFDTENGYDGGVVEYSTNGTIWNDAGPLFFRNPYNASMDATTTLNNRKAFTGTNLTFMPSLLNLSSLGTTPVSFRFRMVTDDGTGVDGWYIDDIIRANGCGGMLKTGVYNSSGIRQDTLVMPVFVVPPSLPLTLLWFYASQVGGQVALDWKTVSEVNVKDFTIEWSSDGNNWTNLGSTVALNRNTNSYNFLHTKPVNGSNYYRIKMNDVDGRFTYSPVRIITITEKGKPMLVLVPNPVNADATLYLSKELKAHSVKVYNASGSLVRQLSIGAGVQQLRINTANLAAGIYTLETVGGERQVTRMMVQH